MFVESVSRQANRNVMRAVVVRRPGPEAVAEDRALEVVRGGNLLANAALPAPEDFRRPPEQPPCSIRRSRYHSVEPVIQRVMVLQSVYLMLPRITPSRTHAEADRRAATGASFPPQECGCVLSAGPESARRGEPPALARLTVRAITNRARREEFPLARHCRCHSVIIDGYDLRGEA